ncbi:hypothetical protein AAG906_010543 [Vitis piasezkii]
MVSLRDAILGLGQRIDGHQAPSVPIKGTTPYDSSTPPPPPPSRPTIQPNYTVPPPPPPLTTPNSIVALAVLRDDTRARIERIEQMMRSLYVIDEVMSSDGYDDLPIAALLVEFVYTNWTRIMSPSVVCFIGPLTSDMD